IAKIAAKIAVGLTLDEIKNPITQTTYACFEPALDYTVVKIPRFPFDKFTTGDRHLGTQMKATGEIMAIGRNFQEALLKGIRSMEIGDGDYYLPSLPEADQLDLINRMKHPDDERVFVIAELFRRGMTMEEVHAGTQIDYFFLRKMHHIIELEQDLEKQPFHQDILLQVKQYGFSDKQIARIWKSTEE